MGKTEFKKKRDPELWKKLGCHETGEGMWSFAVWAPKAENVSLVGDFNGWEYSALPMRKDPGGVWRCTAAAERGSVYKYAVTGCGGRTVLKSDPFALHWESGPATGSKVWPLPSFDWSDGEWMIRRHNKDYVNLPVSIYELHVGSWRLKENEVYPWYRSVADDLADYCVKMGYTHVELLPITEYPFEGSWGYQVTGYFAPTSRYGTPEDFMYFVNRLHGSGIGIIMDWVPGHFPKDEFGLAQFDGAPEYERSDPVMASHPDWGTLIFDYGKPEVGDFLLSSADFFMDVYHIDGLRVDAVSSMLYLSFNRGNNFVCSDGGGDIDRGAVELLQDVNTLAEKFSCMTIAEESSTYPGVTAPVKSGGLGFTFKWDMGFMHDTLDYFELDPFFRSGSHEKLSFGMMYAFSENFILAFSHDEVVHGKKSMLNKMSGDYDGKFANLRALYGFQYGRSGKKLGFMGGEFAQFIEWDYKKQLDWFLLKYPRHVEMQRWTKALNKLYTENPALYENDCSWDGFKWLNVDDRIRSSIVFMRMGKVQRLICACNFTPVISEIRAALPAKGELKRILSSDEYRFGGSGCNVPKSFASEDEPFLGMEFSALLELPPLSATFFSYEEDKR